MAFWSKWFSGSPASEAPAARRSLEYKGYLIEAKPFKEGGQFQLAGEISKDVNGEKKRHRFVRADRFTDKDEAADIAIAKGQLIIDQAGDSMFS